MITIVLGLPLYYNNGIKILGGINNEDTGN
jgi:hypothetical protein